MRLDGSRRVPSGPERKIPDTAHALSAPATRKQTSRAEESAGGVIVIRGTWGGRPPRRTATTGRRRSRTAD